MKIIHRYILNQFLKSFFGAIILTVGLFIIIRLLDNLTFFLRISNRTPFTDYIFYFIYELPFTFLYIYPISCMFATNYTLGKMNSQNEIISMYATGKSILYICLPIIIFIFSVSSIFFIFEETIIYDPHEKHLLINKKMARSNVVKKHFRENIAIFGRENKIYFIQKYDQMNYQMENAHIVYLNKNNVFSNIISARKLTYSVSSNVWTGSNVYIRTFQKEKEINFVHHTNIDLDLQEKPFDFERENRKAVDISAKKAKIIANKLRIIGGEVAKWETEYFFKLGNPFIALIIVFISIPIAVFSKKTSFINSLFLIIITTFIFFIISYVGRSLGVNEFVPPYLGAWLGHIIFIFTSYLLFKKASL